jgi:CBS domain containing-hemolysin-like protein
LSTAITLQLILITFFLLLSACFSGSETAFFSLKKIKLKELQKRSDQRAKTITRLLSNPRRLLITILLGNEAVNVAATATATALAIDLFGTKGVGLAIGGMIFLLLICGEVTPKTIAMHNPLRFTSLVAPALRLFSRLISPLINSIQWVVDSLLSPFGTPSAEPPITEAEFKSLLDASQDHGVLEDTEREMIQNVLELTETTVADVMIPRNDMFCLPINENLNSAIKKIKKNFYARIPVYKENIDHIVGILYTKDLLIYQSKLKPYKDIKKILHPPQQVPQTKKIGDLLRDFQIHKVHLAIVVNERGKTVGLISLHDILEELFGEIADESETKERLVRKLNRNTYKVSTMMHLEDFNQTLKTSLQLKDFETLGGFLQDLWGRTPTKGEKIRFDKLEFTITKVKRGRISEVLVRKL